MSKAKSLGEFEIMVIAAMLRLGDEAYGAAIREQIRERTGRDASVGAIYTTLSRMEEKRLVRSKLGAASAARGGRPKRYFRLTAQGRKVFERSVGTLGRMLDGLAVWPGGSS